MILIAAGATAPARSRRWQQESTMTIALFGRQTRKAWHVPEIALVIALSVGGLILSLGVTAITWMDGPFVGP